MKIHRFFYQDQIEGTSYILLDESLVHQIVRVLKIEPGEYIEIFDGTGTVHKAQIKTTSKKEVHLLIEHTDHTPAPKRKVGLFISILKKENTELAIEKTVEVGVSEIIPIITSRTIKSGLKKERLQTIIKEATEQSGRAYLPTLHETHNFKDALDFAKSHFDRVVLFDPKGSLFSSKNVDSIALFIGPEGGFTDDEITTAENTGVEISSLPTHILRGETAAIIGTYNALL